MAQEDRDGDGKSGGATGTSLPAGFAGAAAVTLINEVARRCVSAAPRLDVLGMRGLAKMMRAAKQDPPPPDQLFRLAMAGDLVSNTLYYSLVGRGRGAWGRGALLGLAAGLGAAFLPAPLGLGRGPTERSPATRLMAVAWYLAGGLAAAAASSQWDRRNETTETP